MPYFARFTYRDSHLFRFDTRIYLGDVKEPQSGDECVAAVVGKNPGSAIPTVRDRLAPLDLDGDRLLPTVRRCFQRSYQKAGLPVPNRAFVRVYNLFYLCDPDLTSALRAYTTLGTSPICKAESKLPSIMWFVWGKAEPRLHALKGRFHRRNIDYPFFMEKHAREIHSRVPTVWEFAKHTQGMALADVETYLAGLLAGRP